MSNYIILNENTFQKTAEQCSVIIQNGGVICVPTDTVYGLICEWDNPIAIERIYDIKFRDRGKPFAVFTDSWQRITPFLARPCPLAETLTAKYWNGALTVLVPVADDCPCSSEGKLGVRSPDYSLISHIIAFTGTLLANTSFNLSQEPALSVLPAEHELFSQVDLVIDAGDLGNPVPSTVVDCTGLEPVILREGVITKHDILCVMNK